MANYPFKKYSKVKLSFKSFAFAFAMIVKTLFTIILYDRQYFFSKKSAVRTLYQTTTERELYLALISSVG